MFNGPVSATFARRSPLALAENQAEFVRDRCLCVAPFGCLVDWETRIREKKSSIDALWDAMQSADGVLADPFPETPA